MSAAANNDLERVQALLAHGANVSERTKGGKTALYQAVERWDQGADNLPTVDALLKAGANPNESEGTSSSLLYISLSIYGNPAVTMRLLQAGAHVPHDCPTGNSDDSLLSLATQESSLEVMRALIANGSPVDCQFRGASALYWAALNGETDRVELLLQSGANPRLQDGNGHTVLDAATTMSSEPRVQADFAKTRQLLEGALKSTESKAQ